MSTLFMKENKVNLLQSIIYTWMIKAIQSLFLIKTISRWRKKLTVYFMVIRKILFQNQYLVTPSSKLTLMALNSLELIKQLLATPRKSKMSTLFMKENKVNLLQSIIYTWIIKATQSLFLIKTISRWWKKLTVYFMVIRKILFPNQYLVTSLSKLTLIMLNNLRLIKLL